jgi:secretion/DNA translocation related CpaE-like protein
MAAPSVGSGRVLAVLGARGGAGASVLAASVGVRAARDGFGALLVDCDPWGGGIDLLLGAEGATGLRWPELGVRSGRIAAASLHAALPTVTHGAGLTVLSCDRDGVGPVPEAIGPVLDAGRRAGEIVVCDLPRQLSDSATAVLTRTDLVVVVVPAEVRACVAARRVVGSVTGTGAKAVLVVRGPAPGGLTPTDVRDAVGRPVLTAMAPQSGLAEVIDSGRGAWPRRGPLIRAAGAVLAELVGTTGRAVGS